jgi:hypothetical protein
MDKHRRQVMHLAKRITTPEKKNKSNLKQFTEDCKTGEATQNLFRDGDSGNDADIGLTEDF